MTGRGEIVSIIDDDRDLGESLARLLRRRGYEATAFDDPRRFLAEATDDAPRCVVTDVMMGDMDGFALAHRVRERLPTAALLFMTAWPQTRDAVAAVRDLGGLDYLEKPLDQDRMLEAIARGLGWSRKRHAASARLSALSAREREVFAVLVLGKTNKQVAARLGISVKTVEDHRAAIMKKTGSFTLADLIRIDPARCGD